MPQLAIDATCLPQYDKLDRPTRERLLAATRKFRELPLDALLAHPDLRIRPLTAGQDPRIRTFRISDTWTGVMLAPESGETFLLVHLLPRDSAEQWAGDQRHDVNTVMGTLERRDAAALGRAVGGGDEPARPLRAAEATAPAPVGVAVGRAGTVAAPQPPRTGAALFEHVSDRDLRRLGIDSEILEFCRTLSTAEELSDWEPALPQDQYEVLSQLAEGHPVERVLREVVEPRRPAVGAVAADDYDTAIRNTRERVIVVNDDQEIEDVLAGEFNAWRIYLHPKQRDLAYRPRFNGPAKVSGGPGTGKTVVALHRVKFLAEHLPLGGRVLLTSFTNALVESLKRNLALLLPPELIEDVDVITADKLAMNVVKEEQPDVSFWSDNDVRGLLANIAQRHGLPWSAEFLFQEYRHVVMAHGITTVDGYLDPDARRGRSAALDRAERRDVWHAIADARVRMRRNRRLPSLELHAEAARILDERPEKPYTNVVIDEAQDLHPTQWRTLRAAAAPGVNDLFIAGDNRQRIYDNTVSFKRLGIRIVGRSYPLRVNYRTTGEILAWAGEILRGQQVSELGESVPEPAGSTRSVLRGSPPELRGARDLAEELDALAERVRRWLAGGIAPGDVCVTTRTQRLRNAVVRELADRGVPAAVFQANRDTVTDASPAVRVTTMHSVKGLEFRAIAVFGATAEALPNMEHVTGAEVDERQHEADLAAQRSLLYVACTRARESLYVSWHGAPSPFLPRMAAEAAVGREAARR
ncbi:3'-5' exonuclease [Marinitenerispora sediminis]|uniref:DNA 3'-5' helicase n=1 Tax=Marinitenerispora sediminis TaxID=1931232 RepID=A0A368TBT7_9ACTN|nr:3'-5' exonuclease [Marinitenerispora sediminis]RCV58154.1 DNA helicase [Marinitenerispora sediminis]RCV61445.1 DNA helicase [Marinitenerispora sediminis]RCV62525.1 DNA helicase [Marinitenerispora sediminis]